MKISPVSFKGITRFGYDDEQSSIKRAAIRKRFNDDIFAPNDFFINNPRLEEYELNKLIKSLTKRGAVKGNKKSSINTQLIKDLSLYNVEPVYGTSSYRGSTADLNATTVKQLKKAGVEGIITFLSYEFDEDMVEENGLEVFCYPKSYTFWDSSAFKTKEDVVWDAKTNYFYLNNDDLEAELLKDKLKIWEKDKRSFINNFIDFIREMKKPNRYIGCICGTETTDEMLSLNYFFNPDAKETRPYKFLSYEYCAEQMKNLYGNLTPEDKKKLGWDSEFDKNFIPRLKKWAPEADI